MKKAAAFFVFASALLLALCVFAAAGFVAEDGGTRYYEDGAYVTGWRDIGGDTYYFQKRRG